MMRRVRERLALRIAPWLASCYRRGAYHGARYGIASENPDVDMTAEWVDYTASSIAAQLEQHRREAELRVTRALLPRYWR